MKNQKGFTLVELIAVIALLGIIAAIITPGIYNLIKDNKQELYDVQIKNIIAGAKNWGGDNVFLMPKEGETIVLTLGMLKDGGYVDDDITNPLTKEKFPDNMIITIINGKGKFEYIVEDKEENKFDQNAPRIILNGEVKEYVEINTEYKEKGVSVTDKNGDKITNYTRLIEKKVNDEYETVTEIDVTKLSTYQITYIATDGNLTSKAYRTVIVRDTIAPVINVDNHLSSYKVTIKQGSLFNKPVAKVTNNSNEIINAQVSGEVNTKVAGVYEITYKAIDSSKNETKLTLTVYVTNIPTFEWKELSSNIGSKDTIIYYSLYLNINEANDVNVIPSDFIINKSAGVEAQIINVTRNKRTYTLTIKLGSGNGTISLIPKANIVSDQAGNLNIAGPESKKITVDNSAPTINNIGATPKTCTSDSVAVKVDAKDNFELAKNAYSFDGESYQSNNSKIYNNNGIYNVTVKDKLDNKVTKEFKIDNIDKEGPDIRYSIDNVLTNNISDYPLNVSVNIADKGCGNTNISYLYCISTTGNSCTPNIAGNGSVHNEYFEESGKYKICTIATDSVGNSSGVVCSESFEIRLPIMQGWSAYSSSDFHNSTYRSNITSVEIVNHKNVPSESIANWDVSAKKDGSVMAWVLTDSTDSTKYNLYIGGNGRVIANSDSSNLFYGFYKTNSMNLKLLDTSKVTDMHGMFDSCSRLINLDVSNFDTFNVIDMRRMFASCYDLIKLDLTSFDTSKVIDMYQIFALCYELADLDLSSFDTTSVTNMSYMFEDCRKITNLNLSSFDTPKVLNMSEMFGRMFALTDLDISNFDTSSVIDMSNMFFSCYNLTTINLSSFDTANVTNMHGMFLDCSGLTSLKVSDLETISVTDMGSIFSGCSGLTQLDVSSLDTTSVINMSSMFARCSGLTQLDVSSLDTTSVTNMSSMFLGCSGLTQLDVSSLETISVINMSSMFSGCNSLTSLDVSSLDTSSVTDMSNMFYNCNKLTNLNVKSLDTSNVTNMATMFSGCNSLTSLDVSDLDTLSVTDMTGMFSRCSSLISLDLSTFDTSSVTKVVKLNTGMFSDCSSLINLNLSNFDTSGVTDMGNMFENCNSLVNLDLSSFDTSNVTNMSYMFERCYNLTSLDLSNFVTTKLIDMRWMFYDCNKMTQLNLSSFDTANVNDMGYTFVKCSSLTSLDLSNFKTSKITDMSNMFSDCSSLVTLDISNFDTASVTKMASMFSGCGKLTSLDLSNFDTSQVLSMSNMFSGCRSLTTLNLSNFDTSSVTDMSSMFSSCSSLTNLDLSNFDTSSVKGMMHMFRWCGKLTNLDVSNFDTSSVTNMSFMFSGCSSLTNLDLSSFDTSNVTTMGSYYEDGGMFSGCTNLSMLDISNFIFDNVTSYGYLFYGMKDVNNVTIYAKDKKAQNFILNLAGNNRPSTWNTTNVIPVIDYNIDKQITNDIITEPFNINITLANIYTNPSYMYCLSNDGSDCTPNIIGLGMNMQINITTPGTYKVCTSVSENNKTFINCSPIYKYQPAI